jgi:hypothetical protein
MQKINFAPRRLWMLQSKCRCPWELSSMIHVLIYIQIDQHRTSAEHSAKKDLRQISCTCNFGERFSDRGNLCAFKASWSVATRRKGWRLVGRLPGRLLLHRRRYNWDDSSDCDNDETACPCYTKGLRLRTWGGSVDDNGLQDDIGDDAAPRSLRRNVVPPTPTTHRNFE